MDIVSLPIVFDKGRLDSRFRLVVLATERARQLMSGAKPGISTRYIKASTISLEELASCEFEYVTGKDARKAIQETIVKKELGGMGVAGEVAEEDEIKKEIEKDLGVYMPEAGGGTEAEGGV